MKIQHQQNEKHWQMKINENTQHQKWTTPQKPPEFSKASSIAESFWLFYGYWWLFLIYVNNYLLLFMIIMQLFIIIDNYL